MLVAVKLSAIPETWLAMLTSLALRWPRERGPVIGDEGYELSMKTPP